MILKCIELNFAITYPETIKYNHTRKSNSHVINIDCQNVFKQATPDCNESSSLKCQPKETFHTCCHNLNRVFYLCSIIINLSYTLIETTLVNAESTGADMNCMRKPMLKKPAKISMSPAQNARVTALYGVPPA